MVRRRAAAAMVMVMVSGSSSAASIQDFCVVGLFSGKVITYKK